MIKLIFNEIYNETININETIKTNHTNIKLNEHVDKNVSEITQNLKLNVYGKENLSYITEDDYKKYFEEGIDCLELYFFTKNFNREHQENNNIFKLNSSNICFYYNGYEYEKTLFSKIGNDIIDVNLKQLYEKYNELKVNMLNEEKEPYEKFMGIYNNKNGKDYDDTLKYLIKKVWRAIFRGNNIPRLIKKSTEDRIYCKKKVLSKIN